MVLFSRLRISDLPNFAVVGSSHVYIIGEVDLDSPVKIGRAANASWRLCDLQSGNPRRLEIRAVWRVSRRLAANIENQAHERLAGREVLGEWFAVTADEAIAIIEHIGAANV